MSLTVGYGDSFPNRTCTGRSLSGARAFKPDSTHGLFGDSDYIGETRTASGSRNGIESTDAASGCRHFGRRHCQEASSHSTSSQFRPSGPATQVTLALSIDALAMVSMALVKVHA